MKPLSRYLYAGFVLLALYYLIILRDFSNVGNSLGIALAFDPFNPDQPWKERPLWQRVWLIIHLMCIVLAYAMSFGFVEHRV